MNKVAERILNDLVMAQGNYLNVASSF